MNTVMDQRSEMEAACHCGTIRFRVKLSDGLKTARRCNCSYCRMRGAVAVSAEAGDISFDGGEEALTVYRFNTGVAEHFFCSRCGIYTHHRRRSNPNQFGVNVACLKGVSPFDFDEVPVFDGVSHPKDRSDGSYRIVGYLRFVPKSSGSVPTPVQDSSTRDAGREPMGVLTDEMQAAVRGERLAYVATVNADGTPNVAPKGTTTVLDADHLVFADIASPRTVANLCERPATEVNVVDPVRRKGWRFAGEGRVVDAGAELETLLAFFRDRGVEIERAGQPRVRCVVVIRVHQAHELISPAYDNGATEADVARSWTSFWRGRLARFDAKPLVGHDAWTAFAAPAGIVLAREDGRLSVEEFTKVVQSSGLNRPIDDIPRMTGMLANSNLVVTARSTADGMLIGVARCVTDFGYCCYLADLCVDVAWQRRGVGRALIAATKRTVGPGCNMLLLSAPNAMTYYPQIRMERADNAFLIRRER